MHTRILGKTGINVSEIGLGCWQLGGDFGPVADAEAHSILDLAWQNGISLWDTADVYGAGQSESRIGQWCQSQTSHDSQSEHPVLITKVGRNAELYPAGYSKDNVRRSLEGSAHRLGLSTLPLVQLHCVPFEVLRQGDIFRWLEDFKAEGLIAHYGASVETVEEGLYCLEHSDVASLQIIFNIFRQDAARELLPRAAERDIGIIVRLPLASGLLSGKFGSQHQFAATDHRHFNRDGQLFNVGETFSGLPFAKGVELASSLRSLVPAGMNMAQMALRWILDHSEVSTVIAGVSKPDQVSANAVASDLSPLSEDLHMRLRDWYEDEVRPHVRGAI